MYDETMKDALFILCFGKLPTLFLPGAYSALLSLLLT